MDRPEIRFRILFEYYEELHSPPRESEDMADMRVRNMELPKHEKSAAQVWLIDSGLVDGENSGHVGSPIPIPFISRINAHGIDYVESVMDTAFTQVKFEDVGKLSKTEKISKFSKDCLKHPVTQEICKVTLAAIVKGMMGSG